MTKVDARVLDRFYAALRKSGNVRSGGGALSAIRVRDVHAILSGALGRPHNATPSSSCSCVWVPPPGCAAAR